MAVVNNDWLLEYAQSGLSGCNGLLSELITAENRLIEYYKDLPNAEEWRNCFEPQIEMLFTRIKARIVIYEKIIEQSINGSDANEFYKALDTIPSCSYACIIITLSKQIKEDCTDFILAWMHAPAYHNELTRLLLTRRESAFHDDLFKIVDKIIYYTRDSVPRTSHTANKFVIRDLIEKTIAEAIA